MEEIEKRKKEFKKKIKNFLNNKHNLAFLGIMLLAIIIRLYYFFITKTQALWWDESDYMAYAKNLAGFNVDWIASPQHNSLFTYLVAGLMKLGFSEPSIKFLLVVIPSFLLVFLTYKICILMYKDKRIALISSFLMATFWNVLFNSFRFHVDLPALLFSFLAIYIFFQGYEKKEKIFGKINSNWAIPITSALIIISYSIRRAYILFGVFFFVYMFSTKNIKELIKDKYNWIGLIIALMLFFFTDKFIFASSLTEVAGTYAHSESMSLDSFKIFGTYFNHLNSSLHLLNYLFWIGFLLLIFNFSLGFDYLKNKNLNSTKSDFFNLLSILITLGFFIFVLRINFSEGRGYDARWYLPLILGSFVCISKGTLAITDYIKKYSKQISIIILIILVGYGGYYELQHSDQIIKNKITSFNGIKQAGIYLNELSDETDIILSVPVPQTAYYSERKILNLGKFFDKDSRETTLKEFLENLKKEENKNLKYIIVTFSEPNHPYWMRKDGQGIIEIPFMETIINFATGQHKIKQSKSYNDITFNLLTIKDDAFIYEIKRN